MVMLTAAAEGGTGLVAAVTSALTTIIGWIGTVLSAVVGGELAELLPLLAVGIAVSAFMLGMRAIRSVIWGA